MDLSQTNIEHSSYSNQIGIPPKPVQRFVKESVAQTPKPRNRQIKQCIKGFLRKSSLVIPT